MNNNNLLDPSELPIGLGMAFAENVEAMRRFTAMSKPEQQKIIAAAHNIKSREEMSAFAQSLVH